MGQEMVRVTPAGRDDRQGMTMNRFSRLAVLSFLFTGLALTTAVAAQDAKAKGDKDDVELSLKSVKLITGFALTTIPSEVKAPDGKVIKIDRANLDRILVPLEDARRVIITARNSAHAQMCDLPELQAENYLALMRTEHAKNKWTPEQMLFINRLHLFTVMWLTGNVKFMEKDGKKEPTVIAEPDKGEKKTCTAEEKANVKAQIEAYLKTAQKS
jgi:hypothetical protein